MTQPEENVYHIYNGLETTAKGKPKGKYLGAWSGVTPGYAIANMKNVLARLQFVDEDRFFAAKASEEETGQ